MNIAVFDSMYRATGPALVDRLNAGVRASAFRSLAGAIDVSAEALATCLGLSPRTLRNRQGLLTADETERSFRAYRVFVRAREVFAGEIQARAWMNTPQRVLGNRTPLSMLVRDVGANEVLSVLGAIEDGGYL